MTTGSVKLYLGPVSSGKSSHLRRKMYRYQRRGVTTVILRPSFDTRTSTHDGLELPSIPVKRLDDLADVPAVVGVDEGQFFPDLYATVIEWASRGRKVYIAALDADWRGRLFGPECIEGTSNPLDLVPYVDKVKKLRAICETCGQDAIHSMRVFTAPTDNGQVDGITIGGKEAFIPLCRLCRAKAL